MNQLIQDAQDSVYIKIYGIKVVDLVSGENDLTDLGQKSGVPSLVKVIALSKGVNNTKCFKVLPFYLLLPGDGDHAKCADFTFSEEVKLWIVKRNSNSLRLDGSSGTFSELLSIDEQDDLIDGEKLLRDYKLDGGLRITNFQINDNRICLGYEIWAKAKVKIFGSWQTLASFSHRGNECINYGACITVFNADIFKADLCFYVNPNRVCLNIKAVGIKVTYCENI